ncbi:hypothetical protein U5801_27350 [Lamprobacter modestohalophilus]|nr:hypothetical protein [Lamprobacter modestohalophilus]MEA1053492.1 hypothetical protein [Lamprobacter modestohalophilus]
MTVNTRVQALDLSPAIEQAMLNDLILRSIWSALPRAVPVLSNAIDCGHSVPSSSPHCSSPRTRSSRWMRRPVGTLSRSPGTVPICFSAAVPVSRAAMASSRSISMAIIV